MKLAWAFIILSVAIVAGCSTRQGQRDDELENQPVAIDVRNMHIVRPRCRVLDNSTLNVRVGCNAVAESPRGDKPIVLTAGVSLSWTDILPVSGQVPQSGKCDVARDQLTADCRVVLATQDTSTVKVELTARHPEKTAQTREARVILPFSVSNYGAHSIARGSLAMLTGGDGRGARAATSSNEASAAEGTVALQPVSFHIDQIFLPRYLFNLGSTCALDGGKGKAIFFATFRAIYRIEGDRVTHLLGGRFGAVNRVGPITNPYDIRMEHLGGLVCDEARGKLYVFLPGRGDTYLWLARLDRDGKGDLVALTSPLIHGGFFSHAAQGPDGALYVLQGSHWDDVVRSSQPGAPPLPDAARTLVRIDPATLAVTRLLRLPPLPADNSQRNCGADRWNPGNICHESSRWGSLAVAADGTVYYSDPFGHVVYKVMRDRRAASGWSSVVVAGIPNEVGFRGDGGNATAALMSYPLGLAVAPTGELYIAEYGNAAIRRVRPNGVIDTVIRSGSDSAWSPPRGQAYSFSELRFPAPLDLAWAPWGGLLVTGRFNGTTAHLVELSVARSEARVHYGKQPDGIRDGELLDQALSTGRPFFSDALRVRYFRGEPYFAHRYPGQVLRVVRGAGAAHLRVVVGAPGGALVPLTGEVPAAEYLFNQLTDFDIAPDGTMFLVSGLAILERRPNGMLRLIAGGNTATDNALTTLFGRKRELAIERIAVESANKFYVTNGLIEVLAFERQADGSFAVSRAVGTGLQGTGVPSFDGKVPTTVRPFAISKIAVISGELYFAHTGFRAEALDERVTHIYRRGADGKARLILGDGTQRGIVRGITGRQLKLEVSYSISGTADNLLVPDWASGTIYRARRRGDAYEVSTVFQAAQQNDTCGTGSVALGSSASTAAARLQDALGNLCVGYIHTVAENDRCTDTANPHLELAMGHNFDAYSTLALITAPCPD